MSMEVIERLNALYHKSQNGPLSPEELAERDSLRKVYLSMIRDQVKNSLEQVKPGEAKSEGEHHCDEDCDCGHKHTGRHS